jgi:uncharacterized Zn-binding protein involved in type VI secretion
MGSPDVNVNSKPALRVDDKGTHQACCKANMWTAQIGSATVFINGKAAHRMNDMTTHCGGVGRLIEGSSDVITGGAAGGGGGGGGGPGDSARGGAGGSAATAGATQDGSQAATGTSGGGAANANSPANAAGSSPATPGPNQTPVTSQATWAIEYDDGTAITAVRAKYEGRTGPKDLDGARNSVPGIFEGDEYSLTLTGTEKAKGVLQDADGQPVANAKLKIERSFGPTAEATTDAQGKYEIDGLITGELYDVTVVSSASKATFTIEDPMGRPMASVRARVYADTGLVKDVTSGSDGKVEVEGLLPGEGYSVEIDPGSRKGE